MLQRRAQILQPQHGRSRSFEVLSEADHDALQHLSDVLHLFQHRNKNQHRRSIWWRHFSVLKRHIDALLKDIKTIHKTPSTHLERTRKTARDKQMRKHIVERLELWQSVLVTKWQSSFSQIVADGRFAVLGLVLIAVLAQVCRITGIIAALEDLGQIEVEKVIAKFGEEEWEADLEHEVVSEQRGEDVGVAILRESETCHDPGGRQPTLIKAEQAVHSRTKRKTATSEPERKLAKKRRKKANAIDDLFNGLD